MENNIKEAIRLLKENDYVVIKLTEEMKRDIDDCNESDCSKDCTCCSCNMCIIGG